MSGFLDKLNLRPQERRLVVFVAIVLFVVFNIWKIFPIFGELGRNQQRILDARNTLQRYQAEIANQDQYNREIRTLREQGIYIASEDQVLQLAREVQTQAALSKVNIQSVNPRNRSSYRTNAFFEEQAVVVSVGNTGEKELVDFLYNLGARDSLTRVRDMNIRPDPTRVYLGGSITLVKSFQRNPPARTAPAGGPASAPASSAPDAASAAPAPAPAAAPDATNAEAAPNQAPPPAMPADASNPARALPKRIPARPIP